MSRSKIHIAFEIGIILKGINALFELIGGTLLLTFPRNTIEDFLVRVSQGKIQYLSPHDQVFAAIYMLSHGIIKGFLVYALLRDKLWAFPWAIAIFAAFGVYQMYEYVRDHSVWMLVLTGLDVFVIVLTILEWRRLKTGEGRGERFDSV